MGRNGLNLGVVGVAVLCLAGCPSETSGDTDGESDTDTDTSMMTMTATMTATMTTMSSTTAMSASDSASTEPTTSGPMTTDDMTTTDTDTDATGTDTDPTGDTDTTTTGGTGDECEDCLDEACGDLYDDCVDDKDCNCWLECFEEGGNPGECAAMCEGFMPPGEYEDYLDCVGSMCTKECAADVYEPCAGIGMGNCMEDLECNGFIGYCSPDCTVEDCPTPATGDATPECSDFSDNCILPCDDATTCPDGMSCNPTGGGNLCTYGL